MSQSEARAWWADVEHVRETIEARRRAAELRAAGDRTPHDEAATARAVAAHDELAARRRARARRDHDDWQAPYDVLAPDDRPARHDGAPPPDDLLAPGDRPARHDGAPLADDLLAPGPAATAPVPAATAPVPGDRREAMAALTPRTGPARPDAPRPRRTVQITGRTVPAPPARPIDGPDRAGRAPRAFRTPQVLAGPQPDRIALWAVILGFVLLVAAATSADAHALAAALALPR